jgi:glyoxylase-like metal-dependent hydrolase (beta-lactamase superfamily II)
MKVIELLPRLHMLDFPVGHAYLWQGPGGLTLIDTSLPGSAPLIAQAIEELGYHRSDLQRLLLTHFHEDHVGSAADVAAWGGDIVVYAHQADAPVIRGETAGPPPKLADWERRLFDQVRAQMPPHPPAPAPVRVDQELEDGDLVDLGGGVHAVTVTAPGHTPGSVAFYLPEPRVLFTGDTIARSPDGKVILGVFNVDPIEAVTSFKRQANLDVELACFGHGEPLTENAAAQLKAAAEPLSG